MSALSSTRGLASSRIPRSPPWLSSASPAPAPRYSALSSPQEQPIPATQESYPGSCRPAPGLPVHRPRPEPGPSALLPVGSCKNTEDLPMGVWGGSSPNHHLQRPKVCECFKNTMEGWSTSKLKMRCICNYIQASIFNIIKSSISLNITKTRFSASRTPWKGHQGVFRGRASNTASMPPHSTTKMIRGRAPNAQVAARAPGASSEMSPLTSVQYWRN